MRRLQIQDRKFGCLKPIEIIGLTDKQNTIWKCLCDCGVYTTRVGSHLFKKPFPKCCKNCNKGPFKGHGEIPITHWNRIKKQAKERDYPFNITIEDGWNQFLKQKRLCALSGIELNFTFHQSECTASLDRINNKLGYEIDNIQWTHKRLNVIRGPDSIEDFINWCKLVTNYNE